MRNLLREGWRRLFLNRMLWICCGISVIVSSYIIVVSYLAKVNDGAFVSFQSYFFCYTILVSGAGMLFTSMFIGTEYSDGTIRNKLIVGCRRQAVYLSNAIVSSAAMLFISVVWFAVCFTLGILMLGKPTCGVSQMLLQMGVGLLAVLAFNALYVFLSMLASGRSRAIVACVVLFLICFMFGIFLDSTLMEPEFIEGVTMSASGAMELAPPEPNPYYISGTQREVYEFLYDLLPFGQIIQLTEKSGAVAHPLRMVCSSLGIIAVSLVSGILVFRKKDIR